jgi:hypothetical protein
MAPVRRVSPWWVVLDAFLARYLYSKGVVYLWGGGGNEPYGKSGPWWACNMTTGSPRTL